MHINATTNLRPVYSPIQTTDLRDATNPYESKYGRMWVNKVRFCPALSPFCPISDLVIFMKEESRRLMLGLAHEENWFFWHDSLSLLTSKECAKCMQDMKCYGTSVYDRTGHSRSLLLSSSSSSGAEVIVVAVNVLRLLSLSSSSPKIPPHPSSFTPTIPFVSPARHPHPKKYVSTHPS